MNPEDIIEALESTTVGRKQGRGMLDDPANASPVDIRNYRDTLMRFLTELDAEITVGELRAVLEDY